ncbi:MAG: ATP-dependent helicase HrpB [Victivallales bacterium]|jgi:ATP-dependent helicase HrpB|nr:ATP-dependent helicase HrpB [Victivallales bacterium]
MNSYENIDLPVKTVLPELITALRNFSGAVLSAAPGAGKTTLVPLALLEAFAGKVILLEPRRVAARAAARRIASLLGESVGQSVGYIVRGENRTGAKNRLTVMTNGVLLRLLRQDPELKDVGILIFDEFHERKLDSDLGLAFALDVQKHLRNDLKILIMSATLESGQIAKLLNNAPIVNAPGRQFPVEIRYSSGNLDRYNPAPEVARVILKLFGEIDGDLLIFLPGVREIDTCAELLENSLPDDALLLKLHGSLESSEQDRVLYPPPPGRRKIVLATNVAESSITIDGIVAVVDSGLERRMRFDPAAGFSFLELMPISKASAIQRAGRAGRTRPGVAIRLWNAHEELTRRDQTLPEVLEADLCALALESAAWGTRAEDLSWLNPPPDAALSVARKTLTALGALDKFGKITRRGRELAELPIHPRLGAMLLTAKEHNLVPLGCELAALLEERDAFRRFGSADLRLRISRMRSKPSEFRNQYVIFRQLLELMNEKKQICDLEKVGILIATAFPDWVGKARTRHGGRYILSGGSGAILMEKDDLGGEDFIAVARLSGGGNEPTIQLAAPIDLEELTEYLGDRLNEVDTIEFEPEKECIVARRELRFGEIVLRSLPLENPPREEITKAVVAEALNRGFALPPAEEKSALYLFNRIAYAHRQEPDKYPDWGEGFAQKISPYLPNVRSFAQLRKVDWLKLLRDLLGENLRDLDANYPEFFITPAGAKHLIDYAQLQPTLSAKIQEFYGVKIHPTVGKKRIPLRIELLSPAQRPVQITMDLPGFWRGNWSFVLKEMKSRYPKHLWPDDPAAANPTLLSVKRRT